MTRKLLAGPAHMKPVLRRFDSSDYVKGANVTGADALECEGDDSGLTGYSVVPNCKP